MKLTFFFLTLLFCLGFTSSAFSSGTVLSESEIRKLLGNYPIKGSVAEQKDFSELLTIQNSRTALECESAGLESRASVKVMFAGPNGPLSDDEMNQIYPRVLKVYTLAGTTSLYAKSLYKRPRPYLTNPLIKPCIQLENSTAYPSGHTTIARTVARVLAQIFPEREEILLKRANEIAFNRVLGGVHHPSDIVAGKKLGDEIAKRVNFLDP